MVRLSALTLVPDIPIAVDGKSRGGPSQKINMLVTALYGAEGRPRRAQFFTTADWPKIHFPPNILGRLVLVGGTKNKVRISACRWQHQYYTSNTYIIAQ